MNDDTINRQIAIDAITDERIVANMDSLYDSELHRYKRAIHRILASLPSAERRGQWEDIEHAPDGLLYVTCSVCGKRQTVEAMNYCGNCGASMMNHTWEEPTINPCRGCEDYDDKGGCISKGECGTKIDGDTK